MRRIRRQPGHGMRIDVVGEDTFRVEVDHGQLESRSVMACTTKPSRRERVAARRLARTRAMRDGDHEAVHTISKSPKRKSIGFPRVWKIGARLGVIATSTREIQSACLSRLDDRI